MRTGSLNAAWAALQFSRAWRSPVTDLRKSDVAIPVPGDSGTIPGTVVRAERSSLRGWIVLHGLTRPGRFHPELIRFVQAVAATGGMVLVPEIKEWTELEFAPARAQRIIAGAVNWLARQPVVGSDGVMLVGFSFGAPQALLAAANPALEPLIRGVVGWGGYADIESTFRFSFTGEHEWAGTTYRQRPDPYARWVIGRNCIPVSDSLKIHTPLVSALHQLAVEAGEKRMESWDPSSDIVKKELRRELPLPDRELFDVFAPPVAREPDQVASEEIVQELVPAIRRALPLVEPLPFIEELRVPVRLLHGRSDPLIPFSESLRMEAMLGPKTGDLTARLTGLFSHSGPDQSAGPWTMAVENVRFLRALQRIFEMAV